MSYPDKRSLTYGLLTLASFGLQAIRRSVGLSCSTLEFGTSRHHGWRAAWRRESAGHLHNAVADKGPTSLVPAWERIRSSLASKGNDSHIGEQCRPERSEETSEECHINAEPSAEADDDVPDNR